MQLQVSYLVSLYSLLQIRPQLIALNTKTHSLFSRHSFVGFQINYSTNFNCCSILDKRRNCSVLIEQKYTFDFLSLVFGPIGAFLYFKVRSAQVVRNTFGVLVVKEVLNAGNTRTNKSKQAPFAERFAKIRTPCWRRFLHFLFCA